MNTPAPGILDVPQELTTATFVNLVGMVVTLEASFLYELYVRVLVSGGSNLKGKWTPPSGATMQWANRGYLNGGDLDGNAPASLFDAAAECDMQAGYYNELLGQIQTDAAGSLQLQARLETAPGSATVDLAYLRVLPIGPL